MKVVVNLKLVRKYKVFTRLSLFGVIATLLIGLVFAFFNVFPKVLVNFIIATIAIVTCYTLLRINNWLTSRWGATPRLDEKISDSLKGLGDEYTIFHYVTDVPHVLIGPNGIFLLEVFEQPGKIIYNQEKKTWKYVKRGNFISKVFTSEKFPDPVKEIVFVEKDWTNFLQRLSKSDYFKADSDFPEPKTVIVFPDPTAELEVTGSPIILTKMNRLKELIRSLPKLPQVEYDSVKKFLGTLPGADA